MNPKTFIEDDFPVREVSEQSVRDRNIRHGHISTVHIWWARKPLASSRASIYGMLSPSPLNEEERLKSSHFISELSEWESALNPDIIDRARSEIIQANAGNKPRVLDPFAGGGSIPLEALRLGCETHASDLNPVAVLILKAILEYPQKYGSQRVKVDGLFGEKEVNLLLEDFKKWGDWVIEEVRTEMERFYPSDADGSIPVGYIWARTVRCKNPRCGVEIPLVRQTWLAKRDRRKVAYKLVTTGKTVDFELKEGRSIDFDPKKGTIFRAKAICPRCSSGLDRKELKELFLDGRTGERMICVVSCHPKRKGKKYRLADGNDMKTFEESAKYLAKKREKLRDRWGMDPVPDEPTPSGGGPGAERAFSVRDWGLRTWGDLFNSRQKLALIVCIDKIRELYERMLGNGVDEEYAKVLTTYLALMISRCSDFESSLVRWFNHVENACNTFARQTLSIAWDYFELNLLSPVSQGTLKSMHNQIMRALSGVVNTRSSSAVVKQSSATQIPYPDNSFDVIATDPPYYDNVPYSHLSDFFYVWLKRSVGDLHPGLFATPLTPKSDEIVAYSQGDGGFEDGKRFFEDMIGNAFKEMARVLKPEGIVCIVFTHKLTEAWEAIVNALLDSGLYLMASWPIHTEMKARLRARESAALASSIYMICRKQMGKGTVYFNEIESKIGKTVESKLDQFWNEGIGGSDFFISAIGPAMEVFGEYESVLKPSGETISAKRLLDYVRRIVGEYALSRILKSPDLIGIDIDTRFYLLWRWTYGSAKVQFDGARLLAQAVGFEITDKWGEGFVGKDKEFVFLASSHEREPAILEKRRPRCMIDVLHVCLLHWEQNDREAISDLLEETGYTNSNDFWRVAQAISDVLPEGDKEKQMLQGFLYGKESYGEMKTKRDKHQTTLFEEEK